MGLRLPWWTCRRSYRRVDWIGGGGGGAEMVSGFWIGFSGLLNSVRWVGLWRNDLHVESSERVSHLSTDRRRDITSTWMCMCTVDHDVRQ